MLFVEHKWFPLNIFVIVHADSGAWPTIDRIARRSRSKRFLNILEMRTLCIGDADG